MRGGLRKRRPVAANGREHSLGVGNEQIGDERVRMLRREIVGCEALRTGSPAGSELRVAGCAVLAAVLGLSSAPGAAAADLRMMGRLALSFGSGDWSLGVRADAADAPTALYLLSRIGLRVACRRYPFFGLTTGVNPRLGVSHT